MKLVTADHIRAAMLQRYPAQEYALLFEVADGTGAAARRYADAVIMSLWPSRGLEIHGVEIKVSRSDYKREARDPTKAEAVAKYCDKWSVFTTPGVVTDIDTLPPAWGLTEFDGKTWKVVRAASVTPAEPLSRTFVASMLRRSDGPMRKIVEQGQGDAKRAAEDALAEERAAFNARVEAAVNQRTKAFEGARQARQALIDAIGIDIFTPAENWRRERTLNDIRAFSRLRAAGLWNEYSISRGLDEIAKGIEQCRRIMAEMTPPSEGSQ